MSRASSVELDFFGMEKGNSVSSTTTSSKTQFQKLIEQRNNVRAVQTAMSIINPQFLKNVITDGGKLPENNNQEQLVFNPFFAQSIPQAGNHQSVLPPLPVLNPSFRAAATTTTETASAAAANATAPFTIFYNGTVSVFEISHDKAEIIMKLAQEGSSKVVESVDPKQPIPAAAASTSSNEQKLLLDNLNGDLPIARKKSLQRFLMKRKERLTTSVSPYANGSESGVDKKLED